MLRFGVGSTIPVGNIRELIVKRLLMTDEIADSYMRSLCLDKRFSNFFLFSRVMLADARRGSNMALKDIGLSTSQELGFQEPNS